MHFNAASQLEPQQEGLAQEGEAASSPPAISPTPPLDQFPGPGGGSSVSSASVGTANPTVPASDEQPARQTAQLISDLRAEMLEINQSNSHNSRLLMMHIKNQSAELAELKKQTACVYSASSVRGEEEENLHGQADSGGGALRRQGSSLPPRAFPRRPEYLQLPEENRHGPADSGGGAFRPRAFPRRPEYLQLPEEDEQIMVQRAPPARALSRGYLRDEASPERDARVYGHIDFPRETDFPRELERQSAVVARGARPLERQETRRLDQAQGSRVAQDGRRGAAYDPPRRRLPRTCSSTTSGPRTTSAARSAVRPSAVPTSPPAAPPAGTSSRLAVTTRRRPTTRTSAAPSARGRAAKASASAAAASRSSACGRSGSWVPTGTHSIRASRASQRAAARGATSASSRACLEPKPRCRACPRPHSVARRGAALASGDTASRGRHTPKLGNLDSCTLWQPR